MTYTLPNSLKHAAACYSKIFLGSVGAGQVNISYGPITREAA